MNDQQRVIGKTQLLEDEELWLGIHGRDGLVEEVPLKGDCVLLTSRRLIGVWQEERRHRQVLVPIENVEAVEVTDLSRSSKPLVQGGLLLLGAAAVIWLAAALDIIGILPWLIAGVIVLLAAVTASTYFVAEESATITFCSPATEVTLSLRTPEALEDAYTLANGFFQVKAGHSPQAPMERGHLQAPPATDSTHWQRPEQGGQGEDAPAPSPASYPPESPQAQRWRDV